MILIYPPWAEEVNAEKRESTLTAKERHKLMRNTLKSRRLIQSVRSYGAESEIQFYNNVLKIFLTQFNLLSDKSAIIWEIISDGLGELEPNWDGFMVKHDGFNLVRDDEHLDYIGRIKQYRKNLDPEIDDYNTHTKIGSFLMEPTLFKITENDITYFNNNKWTNLDDKISPLNIISHYEDDLRYEKWETIDQYNSNLKALKQEKQYSNVISNIIKGLCSLSRDVLWPGLLNSHEKEGKCISLVLIHASTWQVPGVWALHAYIPNADYNNEFDITLSLNVNAMIDPPTHCIIDILSILYRRTNTHNEKLNDIQLFWYAVGKEIKINTMYDYGSWEKKIYALNNDEDPIIHLKKIFLIIVDFYLMDYDIEYSEVLSEPNFLVKLYDIIEYLFISIATEEQLPEISKLIKEKTSFLLSQLLSLLKDNGSTLSQEIDSFIKEFTLISSIEKSVNTSERFAITRADEVGFRKEINTILYILILQNHFLNEPYFDKTQLYHFKIQAGLQALFNIMSRNNKNVKSTGVYYDYEEINNKGLEGIKLAIFQELKRNKFIREEIAWLFAFNF